MALSKSGCSESITKADLEVSYKQGFVEGHKVTIDITNAKISDLRDRINKKL